MESGYIFRWGPKFPFDLNFCLALLFFIFFLIIFLALIRKCFVCFRTFRKVRNYFGEQTESIPMSFVLGFYVTLIVKRWWEQYRLLPWPDSMALFVSAAIPGQVSQLSFSYDCHSRKIELRVIFSLPRKEENILTKFGQKAEKHIRIFSMLGNG